ncbi:YD repeat-containing protein [Amycolatopsis carbonis]|uniref:YD repeat-containing protein n=1 Tax=Amycolatopsis carbonis TaxID=715471 RepID=A0A9Y2MZQ8_9PSEU|nr:RHS repeat domain-containing protein [Amycolatopsis sp. 2-15]WIX82868.1 YD repeat-containing protein [Amycolatopsis sp. 2-15]
MSTATDPDGTMTTYAYDDHGNRISESTGSVSPRTSSTTTTATQIESIDGDGVATVNQYDQADHIPAGSAGIVDLTATTVTQANNVVESTTGNFGPAPARTINYFYDDAAHPADRSRTVDPLGHTTKVTYDTFGNKTSSTDPAGDKTAYGYDTGRGFLTSTVSPVGTAAGVQPGCVPPANGCTTTTYDIYGDVVATTDPLGHISRSGFDADGHKTSVTDANNHTTTDTFNEAGQQVKQRRPTGRSPPPSTTPTAPKPMSSTGSDTKPCSATIARAAVSPTPTPTTVLPLPPWIRPGC